MHERVQTHALHWDQFKLSVHALVRALLDLFCMRSTLCVTVECTIVVISGLRVFSYFGSFSFFLCSVDELSLCSIFLFAPFGFTKY